MQTQRQRQRQRQTPPEAEAVCRQSLKIPDSENYGFLTSLFYGGGGLSDILGPIPVGATI